MNASSRFRVEMLSVCAAAVNGVKRPQVLTSRQFAAPSVFSPNSQPTITMNRVEAGQIKKIFLAELTTRPPPRILVHFDE
jgi:hypothetical protein